MGLLRRIQRAPNGMVTLPISRLAISRMLKIRKLRSRSCRRANWKPLLIDVSIRKYTAATYEIMKNKGLTPHRKKEARNPRVMKHMKYEKAQIAGNGQV